jgi:hypothetical protein
MAPIVSYNITFMCVFVLCVFLYCVYVCPCKVWMFL